MVQYSSSLLNQASQDHLLLLLRFLIRSHLRPRHQLPLLGAWRTTVESPLPAYSSFLRVPKACLCQPSFPSALVNHLNSLSFSARCEARFTWTVFVYPLLLEQIRLATEENSSCFWTLQRQPSSSLPHSFHPSRCNVIPSVLSWHLCLPCSS